MKKTILLAAISLLSMAQLVEASDLKCANEAVKAATASNFKRFGASTGSCGAKLLTAGDYSETYLVCVSDETDPSEWVVVMDKKANKCKVKYADSQYDSQTPNFESNEGLLNTVECSADSEDKAVTCK